MTYAIVCECVNERDRGGGRERGGEVRDNDRCNCV